jgi:ParB family chromosome partitioning protein
MVRARWGFARRDGTEEANVDKKNRLGRGLDALIGSGGTESAAGGSAATVAVERIQNNPYQPRKEFDEDDLLRLSESIRTHGVLQPLVVRAVGDHFQLIAGERRLRASQLAGLNQVPVHVVDFNDQQVLEAALAENIQRTDLNPIEKAQGFREYLDRFQMTQEQLATRLGLDRSTISNLIGLLNLPTEVQTAVRNGQISLGHAKILKGLADASLQIDLCKEVIMKNHSVHALELVAKQRKATPGDASPPAGDAEGEKPAPAGKTAHVQSIEDELRQKLAVRFAIKVKGKDRGEFVIGFESNDDFERVVEVLRK